MGGLSIRWQLVDHISHNLLNIDAMMSNDTSMCRYQRCKWYKNIKRRGSRLESDEVIHGNVHDTLYLMFLNFISMSLPRHLTIHTSLYRYSSCALVVEESKRFDAIVLEKEIIYCVSRTRLDVFEFYFNDFTTPFDHSYLIAQIFITRIDCWRK